MYILLRPIPHLFITMQRHDRVEANKVILSISSTHLYLKLIGYHVSLLFSRTLGQLQWCNTYM
jgi:hypothetical protein